MCQSAYKDLTEKRAQEEKKKKTGTQEDLRRLGILSILFYLHILKYTHPTHSIPLKQLTTE